MKLSAAIQAHPDRAQLVKDFTNLLDRPVPVAWDDEGPPSGNADRGWRTARRAWELADPEADFHLVLQDDAMPCADLLAGLERALEHVPDDAVVSAYLGRGGATPARWGQLAGQASQSGASWVVSAKLMWGVAIVLPVKLIGEMIERADRRHAVTDDMRVAGWSEKRRGEVWYTWPSLVNHRAVPSLTKHRAANRVAQRHHYGSALELSWTGPVIRDPMLARLRGPRSGPIGDWRVTSQVTTSAPGR